MVSYLGHLDMQRLGSASSLRHAAAPPLATLQRAVERQCLAAHARAVARRRAGLAVLAATAQRELYCLHRIASALPVDVGGWE